MRNKKLLLGGLLLLGIGFAAVTTTLYINGTTNIKADTQGFEDKVVFKTVKLNDAESADATISANGKTITFTTPALKSIGETATVKYTIENTSQYIAQIGSLTCTPNEELANTYLSVVPANTLNTKTVARGATSAEDTITVTMKQSYAGTAGTTGPEEKSFTYTCNLSVSAQEAN